MPTFRFIVVCVWVSVGFCHRLAAESPVADGAQLETLASEFKFTEGPIADAHGNVFFTDQPNDRIMKWSTDGKLSTFLKPSGRSNGLFFDLNGTLLACADEKNELWAIAMDGTHKVLITNYNGKLLNGPNDLWVHPSGRIYFTDPLYKRPYWNRGPGEQDGQHVYMIDRDRKTITRADDKLVQPNGIIGTPDGKHLYVADIGDKKTYVYDIGDDGRLSNRTLFCEMGSDGMTIDSDGNVYLTGQGVTIFNSAGEQIGKVPLSGTWTANVCFGGSDRKTLFITATKGLYSIDMKTQGVGPIPKNTDE
ncbi:MAG: SMP-30/gluconolactonase/LRE family protein [Planctomycetales bacterium]|nr:SMP-30/gluconolactonase/LRE family protein [Planctomycetales bacterium]